MMSIRWRAVVKKAFEGLTVMLGAITVTFLAVRLLPGDAAQAIAGGPDANPTREVLAQIRSEYGLDEPLIIQFGTFVGKLLSGDFGTSYRLNTPVLAAITEQIVPTLELAGAAALVAIVISLGVALATAGRSERVRAISSFLELTFASTPTFWLGLLLLSLFSYHLGWLPSLGRRHPLSIVLPALTLGLPLAGVLTQVLRQALEEALEQPFIVSARARGLSDWQVRIGHVLRHAMVPYLTLSGFLVGHLLGGTVITKTLFNRPGLGKLLLNAVLGRDLPIVAGVVLLATIVFVVINFIVDLVYPIIDPRLREVRGV